MIRYEEDGYTIRAYDGENEIGEISVRAFEEDFGPTTRETYALDWVHVDSSHRRQGVGTGLVKKAVEYFGAFGLPPRHPQEGAMRLDSYQKFTPEGCHLLEACKDKGIVRESWFADGHHEDEDF